MLKQPTANDLRSLHVLVHTQAWRQTESYLKDEYAEICTRMVGTSDLTLLHELRGRAKFINEFLRLCGETQTLLEKLEKTSPRKP